MTSKDQLAHEVNNASSGQRPGSETASSVPPGVVDPLKPDDGPELVFGLIGPVGTDLPLVRSAVTKELLEVGYEAIPVRVSSLLHQIAQYQELPALDESSEYVRVKQHMQAGTELRNKTGRGDIMALMAVSEMRRLRAQLNSARRHVLPEGLRPEDVPVHRVAYIVDSLKHPHEVESLREIYGPAFMVIAAYSSRPKRVEAMAGRIMTSVHSSARDAHRAEAEELIKIDEDEEGEELGQNVSRAFPLADCFVDVTDRARVQLALERFIKLLFSHPYLTPTRDEFAMFHASSTAHRSADLSRQVGAVIATKEGDIVAVGCNDVPKARGGLYWCDDPKDQRDFQKGFDMGARSRQEILAEIVSKLRDGGWIAPDKAALPVRELVDRLLRGDSKSVLQEARVTNLIEFGRAVHAEMAAICDAARRGVSVEGTTLFSTTFPCHLCARHVIASGIDRVVFIEPYSKSRAAELYADSMAIGDDACDRVHFEPFVGIAPRQYMNLFRMRGPRKLDSGDTIEWGGTAQQPRFKRFIASYILVEQKLESSLSTIIESAGLCLAR